VCKAGFMVKVRGVGLELEMRIAKLLFGQTYFRASVVDPTTYLAQ